MKHRSNKEFFRFIAVVMLAISFAAVPEVFSTPEPAVAAKKKAKRKAPQKSTMERELDEAARQFVKDEKIPKSVVNSGEIYVIRSYGSTFKAIQGNDAAIYSQPNFKSKKVMNLKHGAKLIADAEWTGDAGGRWYYVHASNKAKGWVMAEYIVDRDPE